MKENDKFWLSYDLMKRGEIVDAYEMFDKYIQDTLPSSIRSKYWNGENITNRRLYIFDEWVLVNDEFGSQLCQIGLGDYLQYSRYFHRLELTGAEITVKCKSELQNLLSFNFPKIKFVQTELPDYDHIVFGCSLPALLGINSIQSYLKPPEVFVIKNNNFLNVGICWAAAVPERSLSLKIFRPILEIPNCKFWAIQKGPALSELDESREALTINRITLHDLAHTASVVSGLDLVISVDTSVSHLAGAMGIPIWLILGHNADLRWGNDGTNIWYPSMEIFRCSDSINIVHLMEDIALLLDSKIKNTPNDFEPGSASFT